MKLTRNESSGIFTLERENGTLDLTSNEMSFLVNQYMKMSLRDSIIYELHEADGDTIDLEKYPYSFDELVDEVFDTLEGEIDYGNYPSDDYIQEIIADTTGYYDMDVDDEDDEEV